MKKLITIIFIFLISIFSISAKTDYQHPIDSKEVATLVIQPTPNKYPTVERTMFIAVDEYDNHFISINVNYFKNKGKDALEITLKSGEVVTLKLDKSIKIKAYSFYPENPTYSVSTTATTVGNYTTAHTTIRREKYDYYEFYSIYPISKELYEQIKEAGIEGMRVEGITSIIIQ